ncbi:MAG: hypothetical protein ACK4OO_05435, partial [bacterium]
QGNETLTIDINDDIQPRQSLMIHINRANGQSETRTAICRLDSWVEIHYYRNGGILQTVLRQFLSKG